MKSRCCKEAKMKSKLAFFTAVVLVLLFVVGSRPGPAASAPLLASWEQPAIAATHLTSVLILPTAPSPVYAVGDGLYRSTDGGRTWTTLTRAFPAAEVHAAPSNPQILYAATRLGCSSGLPGLLRLSTDGGRTWQERAGGVGSLE